MRCTWSAGSRFRRAAKDQDSGTYDSRAALRTAEDLRRSGQAHEDHRADRPGHRRDRSRTGCADGSPPSVRHDLADGSADRRAQMGMIIVRARGRVTVRCRVAGAADQARARLWLRDRSGTAHRHETVDPPFFDPAKGRLKRQRPDGRQGRTLSVDPPSASEGEAKINAKPPVNAGAIRHRSTTCRARPGRRRYAGETVRFGADADASTGGHRARPIPSCRRMTARCSRRNATRGEGGGSGQVAMPIRNRRKYHAPINFAAHLSISAAPPPLPNPASSMEPGALPK